MATVEIMNIRGVPLNDPIAAGMLYWTDERLLCIGPVYYQCGHIMSKDAYHGLSAIITAAI